MATTRTLKMHTKHLTPSNKRESLKENLGQEKQGSRPREKHLYLAMHHQCQHYQQPGRQSNRRDEIHSKAATVWSNKSNWINFSATSNVSTTNNWLLDQRRIFVEESTCQAKTWPLHSTTNRRWPRCHQAHNRTNKDGETNRWSKMVQDRW